MRSSVVDWSGISGAQLSPRRYVDRVSVDAGVPLVDLCEVASGVYADAYATRGSPGAVPYLRVDNVRALVPNLTPGDLAHVAPRTDWGARVRVAAGDVVITRTGTLGRAFVVPAQLEGAVMSQHVTRLRLRAPSPQRAHLLAAFLCSPPGRRQVLALASGSTRPELTHEDLLRLEVPRVLVLEAAGGALASGVEAAGGALASGVETDLRVALSSAQAAIRACDGLVPAAGLPEQSFVAPLDDDAMVSSLAPRFHRPSTARVEAELLSRYECVALGQLARIQRGAGSLAAEYEETGLPYIRTSSIINHGIELCPELHGSEETYRAHGQNVGPGDLLLTMEGRIGAVALLGEGERCLVKNHIELVRLHRNAAVGAELVYAFLSSRVGQVQIERRIVVQATIPGLGARSREIQIPVAGRDAGSRRRLARAIEEATAHVRRAAAARARLRRRLAALLEAVTALDPTALERSRD